MKFGDIYSSTPIAVPAPPPSVATELRFAFLPMGEVPRRWRAKLRSLSLGPVDGAMVRWSYHDGSTWTVVLFKGEQQDPSSIIGWSVFTLQEARHPIIGSFVDARYRRLGYGTALVTQLLEECKDRVPYGKIYAVSDWWPCYSQLIEEAGFTALEWD